MNIMVPLSSMDTLEEFCQAGADEFYFGFYDPDWEAVFGPFEEINRMSSFGGQANFSLGILEDIVKQIHMRGKKAYVTLNSAAYSIAQLKWMDAYVEKLRLAGIDGIIAGSLELVYRLKDCGIPLTMSTMGGAYNSGIIALYQELGISRVILPRDMKLSDMERIVWQFPDIDFEAFLMRNGCKYSDSGCMSYHARKYGSMCAALDGGFCAIDTSPVMDALTVREVYANHALFAKAFHKKACGLCAVDLLMKMGIASVKIVGRADLADSVKKDIRRMRALIDHPGHSRESVSDSCLYQLNCYYNFFA